MAHMLALFKEDEAAASATEALQQAGYTNENFEILTGSPYPEGSFGERVAKHRLYVFPFLGASAQPGGQDLDRRVGLEANLLLCSQSV